MICERCGKSFEPAYVSPSRAATKPTRFCKECGLHNRENGDVVNCTQCGKELYRRKSYLSATRHPFCNHGCYGKWQKLHYRATKEDNREYRYQRRVALERDGYQCQDCGALDSHEYGIDGNVRVIAHHIVERGPDEPPNHDASNLVALCNSCHRRRHHN